VIRQKLKNHQNTFACAFMTIGNNANFDFTDNKIKGMELWVAKELCIYVGNVEMLIFNM
jgi:hypothetical protein